MSAADLARLDSGTITNANEQPALLHLLEALKTAPDGWQHCVQCFLQAQSDVLKEYFVLQVIEHYLRTSYSTQTADEHKVLVKQCMQHTVQRICTQDTNVAVASPPASQPASFIPFPALPAYYKNKLAQIFAMVFVVEFPSCWPRYFEEIFLENLGREYRLGLVELYLRTLLAIDSEVADREIQRSKQELQRNTLIKDNMRELCVPALVQSWQQILAHASNSAKVQELCLNVLGAFIAWIDLSLVANDQLLPLLVQHFAMDNTMEAACDAICSVLEKGMSPSEKTQLLMAVDGALPSAQLYNIDEDTDLDRVVCIAQLINAIGTELIIAWNGYMKAGQASEARQVLEVLSSKTGAMLSCLAHTDQEVSSSVIDYAHQYVQVLKQVVPLTPEHKPFCQSLLVTTLQRYRLPDDYDHEREGEMEVEYLDYRKSLRLIITNIGQLDADLLSECVHELVCGVLGNWRLSALHDIELALAIVYFIGEVLQVNQSVLFKEPKDAKSVRIRDMVKLVFTSCVSEHNHLSIALLCPEIVCRYDRLFAADCSLVAPVLTAFLDHRGVHHASKRVRSRAVYLFTRFIKLQKTHVQDSVDEILGSIQDLLAIEPSVNTANTDPLLTCHDQIFLFEATGTLIIVGNFPAEKKRSYMELLIGNLSAKYEQGLQGLSECTDPVFATALVKFLNNIMSFASRTTKAFSSQQSMDSCLCTDIYVHLMQTFVSSVNEDRVVLLQGVRQYLHRMVICLEQHFLTYVPHIQHKFIALANEPKVMLDYLLLLQQIISKYKNECCAVLMPDMRVLCERIWSLIALSTTDVGAQGDADREQDRRDLTRAYVQLCHAAVANDATQLITDTDVQLRSRIIQSLTSRLCVGTCHKLVSYVHVRELKEHAEWLDVWLGEQVLPLCFALPRDSLFDYADAQCSLLLHECALCLIRAYEYKGEPLLEHLRERYLPDVNVQAEFLTSLKAAQPKQFQKYLKTYFQSSNIALAQS